MRLKTALMGAAATLVFAPAAFAERGADGQLNLFYWQAPSILNPYLSSGTKDLEASSMVIEPLARYNPAGELVPYIAAEVPTVANGGIAEDLMSITWKLKPDLKWADGSDVTADDVVFTGEYCMNPDGGCAQLSHFEHVSKIEAIDPLTVKVSFDAAMPNPYGPFVSFESPILQKAQFANCTGANAPTCTEANTMPVGTGPFKVSAFSPNDNVQLVANDNFREADKPSFASVNMKGGGDAASAARAVFQTGEYDYAWNLQLAPDVLAGMTGDGAKGKVVVAFGSLVERLEMNMTDPSPNLPEGERSTAKHPHPILSDLRVRQALSMAIDRNLLVEVGYGQAGKPTCNLVPAPVAYASDNTGCLTQDVEGAKKLLDEAGWVPGADGIREKDGMKLAITYQTSTNAVRQDFQALIKQWWGEIGVDTTLKNIDASVFFGGDPGSPDTFQKFYADVEMYANNFTGTDPQTYLAQYTCAKAPKPETQWQGENINRYCDETYDKLVGELGGTADPDKRGALAKQLNDMLTKDSMTIVPLVWRGTTSGVANTIVGEDINPWDSELWNIADWSRAK
ncbi:MAG: peptide ABC transporter substrate-binding protein [Defluviimonas sp.]|uniref:peptide ABC transporter substrate-binding protein n=1 Tax=Albidovulum sp. TaxID=1872424 RepID=UPI001DC53F55|nr:peptide ABC transporter substrate-binding protein [Paracoccaceae bacterium]MCC0064863.1 peptide ABC transporter substrate-binding protein [Defluviimonas sp.]